MLYHLRRQLGSPRPFQRLYETPQETELFEAETSDGLILHLRRLRPQGSPQPTPVMLLHGLGSNHVGFHFPGRSIANWLSSQGYDVWMPELRGHGTSLAHGYDWCLDDYLEKDIPAILQTILRESASPRLHWIGHSMGGIVLLCYGTLHPDAPIARAMTVGSALDYKVGNTGFKGLLQLRPVLERIGALPFGTLAHLLSPALGRTPIQAVERFNVWPSNVEPEITRALYASCFHTIPTSLLSSLATTFEPGGLCTRTGLRFCEEVERFPFELRLLAGSRDAQVSVDAVFHTADLVGDNARVKVYGPRHGYGDHYGHWDFFIGRRAKEEVWPDIAAWLAEENPG